MFRTKQSSTTFNMIYTNIFFQIYWVIFPDSLVKIFIE